jgi:hypothetical protein
MVGYCVGARVVAAAPPPAATPWAVVRVRKERRDRNRERVWVRGCIVEVECRRGGM